MKGVNFRKFFVLSSVFFVLFILVNSCSGNIGLGESVDTEAPVVKITYPTGSSVIRDKFVLYGTWTDDKNLKSISISVIDTATKEEVCEPILAKISSDGTWSAVLNDYDLTNPTYYNGWQFADGTYQVVVTAMDNASHTNDDKLTFDIDNTAPLFIISNPGVTKSSGSSASAYGTLFTIEGTIAELHSVSMMDVTIYDSNGNLVSKETYEGEELDAFREEDISTAGGTSVTIAQYSENGTALSNNRYSLLHPSTSGEEKYYCSVRLYDSAKIYSTPVASADRSAEEIKKDQTGNSTYSVYLYDDVYTSLMSTKKGLGLSAVELMNILNGTYSGAQDSVSVLSMLQSVEKDTSLNENNRLFFSLNPEANPTYNINGFEYKFDADSTLQTASSGNPLSVTISAGLDGTNIDPDGSSSSLSTVKVWIKDFDSTLPSDKSLILTQIQNLAASVWITENSETQFVQFSDAASENPCTAFDDWKLIYDYSQNTSQDSSSVSTKTFSVLLPEGLVSLNHYYILAVTGTDVDDVKFAQSSVYAFEGNEAGVAPTLYITSPADDENLINTSSSSSLVFKGTANISSNSLYVSELVATLTVKDQTNSGAIVGDGTYTDRITCSYDAGTGKKTWTSSSQNALAWDSDNNIWTFTPENLSNYQDIKAEVDSGKFYLYSLEIYGKSSSGHESRTSRNLKIDTTKPVIAITSITPTVDGTDWDASINTYLNGIITVNANVTDQNLKEVSYKIFVGSTAVALGTDENGNEIYSKNMGELYSLSVPFDTSSFGLDDKNSFDIQITAVDKAGNSTVYSSLSDNDAYSKYFVYQETDKPLISLTNASQDVSSASMINTETNLFGKTSNNKIMASLSDDDSISKVKVLVKNSSGEILSSSDVYDAYGENPYEKTGINKSTYSLTYYLPPEEGVYRIIIEVYDSNYVGTDVSEALDKYRYSSTKEFFVAVDSGSPNIAITSPVASSYQTGEFNIVGTISKKYGVTLTGSLTDLNGSSVGSVGTFTVGDADSNGLYGWSSLVTLPADANGTYSVKVKAVDVYGQSADKTLSFKVDVTPPVFEITSPTASDISTPVDVYTVKGTIDDTLNTSGIAGFYYRLTTPSTTTDSYGNTVYALYGSDGKVLSEWTAASVSPTETSGSYTWTANISLSSFDNVDGTETKTVYFAVADEAGNISVLTKKAGSSYQENSASNSLRISKDSVLPTTTLLGTSLRVSVDGAAATPLTAGSALTSSETYYANSSPYTLSGAVTEASNKYSLTINEQVITCDNDNGEWSYVVAPLDQGKITYKIVLEDAAENVEEKVITVIYDSVFPELVTATSGIGNSTASIKTGDLSSTWFKNESLIAKGEYTEVTSGLLNVYYTLTPASSEPNSTQSVTSTGAYSIAISGFKEGTNTLVLYAEDKAGNKSSQTNYTVNVDQTAPSFSSEYYTYDSTVYNSASGTVLTNKRNNITIYGKVSDSASGVANLAFTIAGTSVTPSELKFTTSSNLDTASSFAQATWAEYNSIADKKTITAWKAVIPSASIKAGAVNVTPTDIAGNGSSQQIFTFNVDTTSPTVSYSIITDSDKTQDGIQINGYVQFSGTANDTAQLSAVTGLQYQVGTTSSSVPTVDGWIDLENAVTGLYTWTAEVLNTESFQDSLSDYDSTKPVFIRAVATDMAGNDSAHDGENSINGTYLTLYIDQNSDRPTVKITNLSTVEVNANTVYILKYGDNAKIEGTVTDDDSTSTAVVKTFIASSSPITSTSGFTKTTSGTTTTWSHTGYGTTTFTSDTGDWTYTPVDTDDGEKTVYFYIEDNSEYTDEDATVYGAKVFATPSSPTSEATALLKIPYVYYGTIAAQDFSKPVTYKSDSTSPKVESAFGRCFTKNEIDTTVGYESISSSFVAGGNYSYLQIKTSARDANGIAGMLIDVKNAENEYLFQRTTASSIGGKSIESAYTVDATGFKVAETDAELYNWELSVPINLNAVKTGALTITVTPYDNSGLTGNNSFSFLVDNTGPTVAVTSPSSSTTVSGSSISVSGTATETGGSSVSSIKWLIPTEEQRGYSESALLALEWKGLINSSSSVSAWTFDFNGVDNDSLSNYTSTETDYHTSEKDGVYVLPLYLKAEDSLGNIKIHKEYSITYNPDANRPTCAITYPDSSTLARIDGVTQDYAILGGTIRVTGTVEIPSGDSSAYQVYIQIAGDDENFVTASASSDLTTAGTALYKAKNEYGLTVLTASDIQTAWQAAYGSTQTLNFSNDSTTNETKRNEWWGIPATLYASKTSWYIVLNSDNKLNSEDGTNNIKIRACSLGANGKVSFWPESSYKIHVDSNVPIFSTKPKLQKYSTEPTTDENFYNDSSNPATKDYATGLYLKGQWYICTSVTDETAIKVTGVSRGSTNLVYGSDYFVYPSAAATTAGSTEKDPNDSLRNIAYVYVKVDASQTEMQTYTISAEDSDSSGSYNKSTASFELNTDNVAPTFATGNSGNPSIFDSNNSEISMTKLTNSDHVVTFGSKSTDSGSGFERLAFYFKRVVDSTTTIELPLPKNDSSRWTSSTDSAYVASLSKSDADLSADSPDTGYNQNNLYGIELTGSTTVSDSSTTFTASSDISAHKFIRPGAIIKLSGVYYKITAVSSNKITIGEELSTEPTTAFVPAAMIVDNTSAESIGTWSSGFAISGDDGDGLVESVKKSGTTWTWDASVFLDELEDGPITLVTMAFDSAGNVRTLETEVMISNNAPRLCKVYLATDLNGDGKFTDNELGSSTLNDTKESVKYYSTLTNGSSGNVQDIVTIENASGSKLTGLTMRADLGLAFEFVSGGSYEGSGSGNNQLYYKLNIDSSELTTPTSGTDGEVNKLTSSTYDTESGTTTAKIVSSELKGFKIPVSKVTAAGGYTEWVAATSSTHVASYIGVTLWDSTKGVTAGVGDIKDVSGNIVTFGSQYTVVNIPLYIDLVDDQAPSSNINDPEVGEAGGHVELSSTLPGTNFSQATGEYDTDTKVSGTVVFTGEVKDEKRVSKIYLTTSKKFSNTELAKKLVATYNTGTGEFTLTSTPATGLTFAINKNEFTTADGHNVEWSLTVDTATIAGIAASDVKFTVNANDDTNDDDTTATNNYQVDIVPYITGIKRLTANSSATSDFVTINGEKYVSSTTNRSRYGDYAVVKGEYLRVDGFNLPDGNASSGIDVGTTTVNTTNIVSTKRFVFEVPENSGELRVTVNGIITLNDKNSNSSETNLETRDSETSYYDNRYLRVWDIDHKFSSIPTTATTPAMAIGNDGSLYGQYVRGTDAQVILINGLAGTGRQIFRCYDQPLTTTSLSVDSKATVNGGGASSMFFMANVGNSGTVDSWAMTDVANTGGVAVIGLAESDLTTELTSFGTGKIVEVSGNPLMRLDSNVQTSFYPIASFSMKREITPDLFTSPRTVKYGNSTHNVFYDSETKALKYSYVSTDDKGDYMEGSMAGWVVVDGGYNGQDRLHEWSTSEYTTGQYGLSKRGNNNNYVFTSTAYNTNTTGAKRDSQGAAYASDLIQLSPASKTATSCTVTVNDEAYWKTRLVKGSTIAFLTNGQTYTIDLATITSVSNTGTTFTLTYDNCSAAENATYATVYTGAFNVVGLTAATAATTDTRTTIVERSSAAGKYSAIDVTTGGYPVIAYFDSKNETVRVAYATATSPTTASQWNRVNISGVTGGTHVSMTIDPNNVIHIMYRNSNGMMEYVKGEITGGDTGVITGITFGAVETVDSDNTTGTYGSISTIYNFENSDGSYTPCVTYLNSEETENAVKYSVRRKIDDGNNSYSWDSIIVPSTDRYAVGGSKIYLGGKTSGWTTVAHDGISVADCYSIVGYLSSGMDVLFLKTEK